MTFLALLLLLVDQTSQWQQPPFTKEMRAVLATCKIARSQVRYFQGVEERGYAIVLTKRQDGPTATTTCLSTEINRYRLQDQIWFVSPYPDAKN